ncbi:MAG TPA: hypothetical protein VFS67_35565 [Polyangiaceae bacterium]|nr:hypothetical protein [Polyangiaceae bacterium]
MLKPYRAPSGRVRVLDTDTNTPLPESDPRCARFVQMSDRELQLAGGYSQTPPERISFDTPIHAAREPSRGRTTSMIVHMPASAPSAPSALTPDELKIAAMLGVSPTDFARQRRAEQTGAGGAGRWSSGAASGEE